MSWKIKIGTVIVQYSCSSSRKIERKARYIGFQNLNLSLQRKLSTTRRQSCFLSNEDDLWLHDNANSAYLFDNRKGEFKEAVLAVKAVGYVNHNT